MSARKELYKAIIKYWKDQNLVNFKESVPISKFVLTFDYSDGIIGNLSQFIIDLDEAITIAVIQITFDLLPDIDTTLENLKKKYDELLQSDISKNKENKCLAMVVRDNFSSLFTIKITARAPSSDSDYSMDVSRSDLQNLSNMKIIMAERNMDESATENTNPLGQIMKKLFSSELEDIETSLKPSMTALNQIINESNFVLNEKINSHMDAIVSSMMTFGYPSWDDLKLRANMNLSLQKHIIHNTQLTYVANSEWESLPETYNGLGYKNLIKITMELKDYARTVKDDDTKLHFLNLLRVIP